MILPSLFARLVVPLRLGELLHIVRRELRPVDRQRQLVERAGEREWHLVIVGHRRAGVGANVEVLVPLQDERDRALHALTRHLLAVYGEHTRAAAADAADVVEGERA